MIKEAKNRPAEPAGPTTSAIIKRTLAHWPIAAAVMLIGAAATAEVVHLRKPAFKSETVIFYREGIQKSLVTNDPSAPDPLRTLGAKLKEMLLAQSNLKKVIHEKNLYDEIIQKQDENAAVEQFRKKIDFKARSTDTFVISFEGTSREEAQEVTARLAELLVEQNAQIKQDQAKTTTEFLDAEKKRSDEELSKAESELAQFVADHPEFAGNDAQTGRVGISVRAQQVTQQGAANDARQREAKRKASLAPNAPGSALPPSVDPALVTARASAQAEVASARRDLADKAAKYTDDYPDVRTAKQRVATAEAQLRGVEDQISAQAAAAPQPPPAPPPSAEPRAQARQQPKATGTAPAPAVANKDEKIVSMETDWARLNRDVTKARQRAADLENRLFKAEMTASSELGGYSAQIAVLDPAYRPTGPSSMPNKTVVAAGFLASLLLGGALAALRGLFMDDRIFDESEIEPLAVGQVIAVVPRSKTRRKARGQAGGNQRG
jgi:uncharacterized protein involved in exopolysaccharide biosynthesis